MKNVIAVEMVNTSTGKTAFTAKYVWDDGSSNGGQSGYRLLNWTYYDYGAYPYDLVGTYNSNGTYSKVEIQRVTGESTHTTTDEYGSVTTTVKDSEGRDKSVTMAGRIQRQVRYRATDGVLRIQRKRFGMFVLSVCLQEHQGHKNNVYGAGRRKLQHLQQEFFGEIYHESR